MHNNIQEMMDNHDTDQIAEIAIEYGRLFDWFHSQYPEGDIRLDINNDKRNGTLNYKLTVMTGTEATPNNRGLFSNTITIDQNRWDDIIWMQKFKHSIYEKYKTAITRAYNNHYNAEKVKSV